ncbi:MAG: hypothetical protein FJ291_27050 [Planctomycetes bacterium]|nr:hypothetical protein [Planctomycetota bacterium]
MRVSVWLLCAVAGCGQEEGSGALSQEAQALAAAKAQWEKNAPGAYEIVVRDDHGRGTSEMRLQVVGTRIASAEQRRVRDVAQEPFEPIMPGADMRKEHVQAETVPGLFAKAAWCTGPKRSTDVAYTLRYDAKLRYPVLIAGRRTGKAINGDFATEVVSFKVLDPNDVKDARWLAGSALWGMPVERHEYAFAGLCQATDEPRFGDKDANGKCPVSQKFTVAELYAGQVGPEPVELRYEIEEAGEGRERALEKGERAVWCVRLRDDGSYEGVKAAYDTPTNRRRDAYVSHGPTAQTPQFLDLYPWVRSTLLVRCKLGADYQLFYRAGEPVVVALEVQNAGREALSIWSELDAKSVFIRRQRERAERPAPNPSKPLAKPILLKPGESHRVTADLSGLDWGPKPEGRVHGYAVTWQAQVVLGTKEGRPTTLVSNPISITLGP